MICFSRSLLICIWKCLDLMNELYTSIWNGLAFIHRTTSVLETSTAWTCSLVFLMKKVLRVC